MNKALYGALSVVAVIALAVIFTAAPAAADVTHLSAGAFEFARVSAFDLSGLAFCFGMSTRLKELREKRGKLVNDMRAILDTAGKESRDLSGEEQNRYDTMFADQERIGKQITTEERQVELERETTARVLQHQEEQRGRAPGTDPEQRTVGPLGTQEYRAAFRSYLLNGSSRISADEVRALSAGAGPEGGFLIAPEQFVAELLQGVDNMTFVRRRGTRVPVVAAQSIGIPTLDADPADADWTTELGTGSADSTMAFGKRAMKASAIAKRIKVSNQLLQLSALPAEQIVRNRFTYKFGVTQEKAYLTGSGVNQPLGMFTASNDGIPTSRDVATDNTSTAITCDGLINAKYSVKSQYWAKASWAFHRDGMKMISKLKDTEGQYIWRASVREGEPDTLLGHAIDVSEYVPNTFTTGLYVGLFGDMSYYWYLDSLAIQIQRLNELYAETNQVGFIGRYEGDGAPVMAEAFARVKLG